MLLPDSSPRLGTHLGRGDWGMHESLFFLLRESVLADVVTK